MAKMANLPLIVKGRSKSGALTQLPCDTVERAIINVKHFRDAGYAEVWIEDRQGHRIDERSLNA
jgi:hypothetical protein